MFNFDLEKKTFTLVHTLRLGSTLSMGKFVDPLTNEFWLGKSNIGERLGDDLVSACREKLANELYGYFGIRVPQLRIVLQDLAIDDKEERNFWINEMKRKESWHLMSHWLDRFEPYGSLPEFSSEKILSLKIEDHTLPERGLGHILAVAHWINDVDVLGPSGGNVGFQLQLDEKNQLYALSCKIDPGYAFSDFNKTDLLLNRYFSLATSASGNSSIAIDQLPERTQQEYLQTVSQITALTPQTLNSFFTDKLIDVLESPIAKNREDYISVKALVDQLTKRQLALRELYVSNIKKYLKSEVTTTSNSKVPKLLQRLFCKAQWVYETQTREKIGFYIPLDVSDSLYNQQRSSLANTVDQFLQKTTHETLLLIGASGAGKSLFTQKLEHKLWEDYLQGSSKVIPLRIELKQFSERTVGQCVINTLLEEYRYSTKELQQLQTYQMVFILDGFDEIASNTKINLLEKHYALDNKFGKWKARFIITCRDSYYDQVNQSVFYGKKEKNGLVVRYLLPLTPTSQINYLTQYRNAHSKRKLPDYQKILQINPRLHDLLAFPLILYLFREALPQWQHEHPQSKIEEMTQYSIFDSFIKGWFAGEAVRLCMRKVKILDNLPEQFMLLSMSLAVDMFEKKIEVVHQELGNLWNSFFANKNAEHIEMRMSCPLRRQTSNTFSFIHKSFLEFFVSQYCLQHLKTSLKKTEFTLAKMWPKRLLNESPLILQFLSEAFAEENLIVQNQLKDKLFDAVKQSKGRDREPEIVTTAANAITLLNYLRTPFVGPYSNLKEVCIKGANLQGMVGHKINFQGANLTGVNLQLAYLVESHFEEAILKDVQLGEMPSLIWPTGSAMCSCFTPDGQRMIVGGEPNNINIYDLNSGNIILVLNQHTDRVINLEIDREGKFMLSHSRNEVILWDLKTYAYQFLEFSTIVSFFPKRNQIIFISNDQGLTLAEYQFIQSDDFLSGFQRTNINERSKNFKLLNSKNLYQLKDKNIKNFKITNDGRYILFEGKSKIRFAKIMHSEGKSPLINNELELYDLESKKTVRMFSGYLYAFSCKSELLAIARNNEKGETNIDIYNLVTRALEYTIEERFYSEKDFKTHHESALNITDLKFSPIDKNILIVANIHGRIDIWDMNESIYKAKLSLKALNSRISCMSVAKNGQLMLTAEGTNILDSPTLKKPMKLWDLEFLLNPANQMVFRGREYKHIAYFTATKEFLCAENNEIKRFSFESGKYKGSLFIANEGDNQEKTICKMHVIPPANNEDLSTEKLLITTEKGDILIYKLEHSNFKLESLYRDFKIDHVAVCSSGLIAITDKRNNPTLTVLNIKNGKVILKKNISNSPVLMIDFSKDKSNQYIAFALENSFIIIDRITGEIIFSPPRLQENNTMYYGEGTLCFSANNVNLLATLNYVSENELDRTNRFNPKNIATRIDLWDIKAKVLLGKLPAHDDIGTQLCFSPNGQYLVSASEKEIVLIEVNLLKEVYRFDFGEKPLIGVTEESGFSIHTIKFLNEHTFATCQYNHSVKMWRIYKDSQNQYEVRLHWHIPVELIVNKADFRNAIGVNQFLLKQKGAVTVNEKNIFEYFLRNKKIESAIEIIQKASLNHLETYFVDGKTFLHLVVEYNATPVAKVLLARTTKLIEIKNRDGLTPLLQAFHLGKEYLEILIMILESSNDFKRLIALLAKNGCKSNTHPWLFDYIEKSKKLLEAVVNGDLAQVKSLREAGGSPTFKEQDHGCNALILAGGYGKLDIVKWLIEEGVPVDVPNKYGSIVLHTAAEKGQTHVVKWLLENRICHFDVKNDHGIIPLYVALDRKQFKCAQWMIEYADNNENYKDSSTLAQAFILFIWAKNNDINSIVEFKKEIGISDSVIFAAINIAKEESNIVALDCLSNFNKNSFERYKKHEISYKEKIENHSDNNFFEPSKNLSNQTDVSRKNETGLKRGFFDSPDKNHETLKHTLKHKYNLKDVTTNELERGLRKAAANNQFADIAHFVKVGVDINAADPKQGKTALDHAIEKKFSETIIELLKYGARRDTVDSITKPDLMINDP